MSETILKVLLEELKTIRLICKKEKCRAVTEVSLEHLPGNLSAVALCPVCGESFEMMDAGNSGNRVNPLKRFSDAFVLALAMAEKMGIEFPIKQPKD